METIVTSSGSGIAVIPDASQPIMVVANAIFIFDLTASSLAYLKTYLDANGSQIDDVTVFQLQKYLSDTDFQNALIDLIKYGIYENQLLCEHCYVITTIANHTTIANATWPGQAKAITKYRGRKWPQGKFVSEFIPVQGQGSVGPKPGTYNDPEIISWSFTLGYKTDTTSETYTYDPVTKTLPIPLEDGVTLPDLPSATGTVTSYSIIYYFLNEYTTFPFVENHSKSMGSLTTAHDIDQNTITVHVRKQDHVEIIANVSDSGGGA